MFYALAHASPHDIVVSVEGIVYGIGIRVGLLLLVLGIADYSGSSGASSSRSR